MTVSHAFASTMDPAKACSGSQESMKRLSVVAAGTELFALAVAVAVDALGKENEELEAWASAWSARGKVMRRVVVNILSLRVYVFVKCSSRFLFLTEK